MQRKYQRDFYLQDTFEVARALLGSYLCTQINGHLTAGKIVEIEAYIGAIDKAAHSYPNKKTKRTAIQFGLGGYAYIFLIYGMYSQFCVVTGNKGIADVILIRAIEPIVGIEIMQQRRNTKNHKNLTNGPGKLCQSLGITTQFYGEDLLGNIIWIAPKEETIEDPSKIATSKRIGIDYAEEFVDKPWRFFIATNPYVSRFPAPKRTQANV